MGDAVCHYFPQTLVRNTFTIVVSLLGDHTLKPSGARQVANDRQGVGVGREAIWKCTSHLQEAATTGIQWATKATHLSGTEGPTGQAPHWVLMIYQWGQQTLLSNCLASLHLHSCAARDSP